MGKSLLHLLGVKKGDFDGKPAYVALPNQTEQAAIQVKGMVTVGKVRTLPDPNNLSSGVWLSSHVFYDKYGRVIQSQNENMKGGSDIVTNRYDFSGKLLTSILAHSNFEITDADLQSTLVKTSMEYDHSGALLKVFKTINDGAIKLIVENEYNEMGELTKKKLGKTVEDEPVEELDYTYNIRGWLKGINKDYAGGDNSSRKFGMELSYDWGFDVNQYNGNICGTKWRSVGDGEQRAYGFGYDKANRLMFADFNQYSNSFWDRASNVNFTSLMGDGLDPKSAYDENGNILSMKQWGYMLESSNVIDLLYYTYENGGVSNRLKNVIDLKNASDTKLGDFRTSQGHSQIAQK